MYSFLEPRNLATEKKKKADLMQVLANSYLRLGSMPHGVGSRQAARYPIIAAAYDGSYIICYCASFNIT